MKQSLKTGLTDTRRITVDVLRTIDFMGKDCRVYATPELVRDIELTCRDLLLQHLDPGEDSVGTRVELDHMAPTGIGMWTEISITVTEIDGRVVTFDVSALDEVEQTAAGKHYRFIVDVDKTAARLREKIARAGLK
jgi:fluoroacetyl-CoA thioesterase